MNLSLYICSVITHILLCIADICLGALPMQPAEGPVEDRFLELVDLRGKVYFTLNISQTIGDPIMNIGDLPLEGETKYSPLFWGSIFIN